MNRQTWSACSTRLGHERSRPRTAGRRSTSSARRRRLDVVLLDLVMPELDGFESLAAIKADPDLARDPGDRGLGRSTTSTAIVRCIEMGAVDYLPRPIKPTLLQARVQASLADKRLRDDNARLLATVERQRRSCARFLSPQVAALVSTPGGRGRCSPAIGVTSPSVFCDLRGFTAFGEAAEPEEMLVVLREYHEAMGALSSSSRAPRALRGRRHPRLLQRSGAPGRPRMRAVRMAVGAARGRRASCRRAGRKRGFDLGFGVGIASGYATAGRIGFEGRYDYASVGTPSTSPHASREGGAGQILVRSGTTRRRGAIDAEAERTACR